MCVSSDGGHRYTAQKPEKERLKLESYGMGCRFHGTIQSFGEVELLSVEDVRSATTVLRSSVSLGLDETCFLPHGTFSYNQTAIKKEIIHQ